MLIVIPDAYRYTGCLCAYRKTSYKATNNCLVPLRYPSRVNLKLRCHCPCFECQMFLADCFKSCDNVTCLEVTSHPWVLRDACRVGYLNQKISLDCNYI